MHVLELVAWLCNCALSLQSECDAVCGGGGGGGRATMGEMEVEAAPPAAQSISREQAYAILAAMQKLECSSLADDLQQSAAPGPDQLRTLRLSLLGIFCASVIQDNASRGAEALRMGDGFLVKSRGERYEERVNSMAMSSRFLRPTARVADSGGDGLQEVFAYELLTGASMSY